MKDVIMQKLSHHRTIVRSLLVLLLALCMGVAPAALADGPDGWQYDENGQKTHWIQDGRPVTSTLITDPADGEKYWLEADGTLARSKQIYDPASDAWYWVDADGTVAVDKDVYIPEQGKWVRYDSQGRMIKGEDCRYGGWYYFDPITGAMAKGMRYIPSNGGKWVYYDWTTGQMAHGERYVDYDREHTGWYLFDPVTGAMYHGFTYIRSNGGKWVYYDQTTGIMDHDLGYINGAWYYFDHDTGKMAHRMTYVPEWNSYKYFDDIDGRWNQGQESADWNSPSQEAAYPDLSRVRNLNVQVSIANQQVYVRDGDSVIYTMIASTGVNDCTPRGTYTVNGRGASFMNPDGMGANNWVQFLGNYLFHSVPIDRSGAYIVSEAQKLGRPASHGCVRLTIPDSRWLYDQLRDGTRVTIY